MDKKSSNQRPKSILVVDDEEIVRVSCYRVIEPAGHVVTLASSAREALAMLEYIKFDIVLTDLKMPEMDGFELASIIKDRWPDVKVIIMTGYYTEEVESESQSSEIDLFLEKPFLPDDILAIMR